MKSKEFGSGKDTAKIWYNSVGDCIQFKTDHVPSMRKRIDEYLTLYLTLEDQKPIGFQLKDVHALINKYEIDLFAVQAEYTPADKKLISITTLILKAFSKMPANPNRISGYTDAFNTIVKDEDKVEIPV